MKKEMFSENLKLKAFADQVNSIEHEIDKLDDHGRSSVQLQEQLDVAEFNYDHQVRKCNEMQETYQKL